MNKDLITKTLDYCGDTGYLYYIRDMKSGHKCGDKAGYLENTGYIRVRIGGKNYQAHRIAWFLFYKSEPTGIIDHIDGDKTNNKILNLRDSTRSQNLQNQKKSQKGSDSGILGVSKYENKWIARIDLNGVQYRLGIFETKEAAGEAYLKAKRELHDFCTI